MTVNVVMLLVEVGQYELLSAHRKKILVDFDIKIMNKCVFIFIFCQHVQIDAQYDRGCDQKGLKDIFNFNPTLWRCSNTILSL